MIKDAGRGATNEVDINIVWIREVMRKVEGGTFVEEGEIEGRYVVGPVC